VALAQACVVLPGIASGRVLRPAGPVSFWGGVDPATGCLTDPGSPHHGTCVAGRVMMLPATRGSSSSSAVLLQLLHAGLAPAALVLGTLDAILGLGILVAAEMGWPTIPLLTLPPDRQDLFHDGESVRIDPDGGIVGASCPGNASGGATLAM
jgi:predicted aconitase with swiveling domain